MTQYGLDGIDFDDEYADYGTNNTPQPNASSFVYLVQALRKDMPSKLITHVRHRSGLVDSLSYNGTDVGALIQLRVEPVLRLVGRAGHRPGQEPALPGGDRHQRDLVQHAASLAQQTVNNGYGVFLTYNLGGTDMHSYISSFTSVLYGSKAVYSG